MHSEQFDWPEFDERTGAVLCYTSGTTGNPQGSMFSHRSIVLNAMMICAPGILSVSSRESHTLPIVPMFHVNGWCILLRDRSVKQGWSYPDRAWTALDCTT